MRKYVAAAGLLLAATLPAVAANGDLYLAAVSTDNGEAWFVDGSTIRAAGADRKTAVVFIIRRGLQADFGRFDFDCKGNSVRQITLRHYEFGPTGAIVVRKDMPPEPEAAAASGTLAGETLAYVCGAPGTLEKDRPIPKISNDAAASALTLARVFGKTFKEK